MNEDTPLTPLIDLLDDLIATCASTNEACDKLVEALAELPSCVLDLEPIFDIKRACVDSEGRWFHSVEEADKYDQMRGHALGVRIQL